MALESHHLCLIIPYLLDYIPSDHLSRLSLVSREIHEACSILMKSLQIDYTRGAEEVAIPCSSGAGRFPRDFRYIQSSTNQPIIMDAGCSCGSAGCDESCPCLHTTPGRLDECGPACKCSASSCSNRETQGGVCVPLSLVDLGLDRGWGVLSRSDIPSGSFLSEYVGEMIRNDLAEERLRSYDEAGRGHALLSVRQVMMPSGLTLRSNIDATSLGNISRYYNHSCEPNLELVVVHRAGSILPSVCLFAIRDIRPNEELTFSYGSIHGSQSSSLRGKKCLCGAARCHGVMPAE